MSMTMTVPGTDHTRFYKSADPTRIGHLRGDFGRTGEEFWTTWFDCHAELKTDAFRNEFNRLVNQLRERDNLLADYRSMAALAPQNGTKLESRPNEYGLVIQTDAHEYYEPV